MARVLLFEELPHYFLLKINLDCSLKITGCYTAATASASTACW